MNRIVSMRLRNVFKRVSSITVSDGEESIINIEEYGSEILEGNPEHPDRK